MTKTTNAETGPLRPGPPSRGGARRLFITRARRSEPEAATQPPSQLRCSAGSLPPTRTARQPHHASNQRHCTQGKHARSDRDRKRRKPGAPHLAQRLKPPGSCHALHLHLRYCRGRPGGSNNARQRNTARYKTCKLPCLAASAALPPRLCSSYTGTKPGRARQPAGPAMQAATHTQHLSRPRKLNPAGAAAPPLPNVEIRATQDQGCEISLGIGHAAGSQRACNESAQLPANFLVLAISIGLQPSVYDQAFTVGGAQLQMATKNQ